MFLLDVNVLLALAWPNHQFHATAQDWFCTHCSQGWATCAVTQLGFVRLSSNPAFTSAAVSPFEAAALLKGLCAHPQHAFVESDSIAALTDLSVAFGHRQVTDAYLLALANSKGLRLATFDQRLASLGSAECVCILPIEL